ncbi:MAG: ABC transporter permease [Proteobacteria bacterium]|nr:ABC transporter permease [Pseudomonadota bacterium]
MNWVLLKTDALFFMLVVLAIGYALYARRHEHLRAPWRRVCRRPLGMGAAVILASYVVVATLDTIHFHPRLSGGGDVRYSSEISSVFDIVVKPLKVNVEKTYSAPFAAYAFAKEVIELPDGGTKRDFPRLAYGGAHLAAPEKERASDISIRSATGIAGGLAAWLAMAAVLIAAIARNARMSWRATLAAVIAGRTSVPWRVILATFAVVAAAIGYCAAVAPYYHILGTDKVGSDVLYQGLKSIRTGLLIGTLATLVMLPFAVLLGIAAGYFRGWVDDVIQYLYTTLSSIPGVLLIAAAALMLEVYMAKHAADYTSLAARADLKLLALCMILGVTTWTGLCRYLRGEALKLRELDFIEAARAFGVPHSVIIARHIVPNIMHIVMISIVLDFSGLVLAEAALTYIDIGVDPSMESWGNMINSARLELAREPVVWWSLLAAFVFMFTLVLAANVFADAVRDAFDPRLREAQE